MTLEEFDALPDDDGVERWIDRRLALRTTRNPSAAFPHSRTEAKIAYLLTALAGPAARPATGLVLSGEAGFHLRREPSTKVGIDVAYVTAEQAAATPKDATIIEGPPVLAVEILSRSDRNSTRSWTRSTGISARECCWCGASNRNRG